MSTFAQQEGVLIVSFFQLHGQRGDDKLFGDEGHDEVYGELGSDTIYGGEGDDILVGDIGTAVRRYNDGAPLSKNNKPDVWVRLCLHYYFLSTYLI